MDATAQDERQSPDQVVGAFVRRLRESQGYRQDYFARMLNQQLGLRWSGPTVTKIEAGQRSVKAWELLAILWEFDPAIGDAVKPGGKHPHLAHLLAKAWDVREAAREDAATGRDQALEVERNAADRLGVTVDVLRSAAAEMWGCSFDEQRATRLAERGASGQPVGRGATSWVVRQMIDELGQAMKRVPSKEDKR